MVDYGNPEREPSLIYDRQLGQTPQLGGIYGLSSSLANQYGQQADRMKGRVIGNEYSSPDIQAEAQARQQQMAALEMQRQMAMGTMASPAEQQYRLGLQNAAAGQQAQAASTMGGMSAMAAAQRGAMTNNVNNGIIGAQQAQMIRAQEMQAARDRYAAGLAGMRGQDQGMWNAMQGREMGQAGLNDAGVLASQGMANGILTGQMQADAAAYAAQQATRAQRTAAEKQRRYGMSSALAKGAVQAGVGVVTAGAGSGAFNGAMNSDQGLAGGGGN